MSWTASSQLGHIQGHSHSVPDRHIRHQVVLPGGRNRVRTCGPSLVSKVCSVARGCWKWPDVPSNCGDRGWEWPGVSWRLRSLALTLALGLALEFTTSGSVVLPLCYHDHHGSAEEALDLNAA